LNSSNQFSGDYLDHDLCQQQFGSETLANMARWAAACGSARPNAEYVLIISLL